MYLPRLLNYPLIYLIRYLGYYAYLICVLFKTC